MVLIGRAPANCILPRLAVVLRSRPLSSSLHRHVGPAVPRPPFHLRGTASAAMAPLIGTHNGSFHADEIAAIYMIKLLPEYKDAEIIRTRDKDTLDTMHIVVDVGAVYEPERNRFDHHQRGFTETFSPDHKIKLSSAGLIYKHFGKRILAQELKLSESDPSLDRIFKKFYEDLIEGLDAVDNGVKMYDTESQALYVDNTTFPARISSLNPDWNEDFDDAKTFERFLEGMEMFAQEFQRRIRFIHSSWMPAHEIVVNALEKSTLEDGRIILLDRSCPWIGHLFDLEKEKNLGDRTLYAIYQSGRGDKDWRIHAVPVTPSSFNCRLALPEPWRGIRDDDLSKLSGIPGCIFVHASGFMAATKSRESAIELARQSILFGSKQ